MTYPDKAYKNLDFLNSPAARHIRILCEYEETRQRFLKEQVEDTIVVFGSARLVPPEELAQSLSDAQKTADAAVGTDGHEKAVANLERLERLQKMGRYYSEAQELCRRLTQWSLDQADGRYLVCSGGGPGIMEAVNRGAAEVDGGRSVGLGISLPFEEKNNVYVTPELSFEFHYFFMRKYWFMYLAKALIVMPGGFGTLDEFLELLTLRQTQKIKKKIPTVLYGKSYWNSILNLDVMIDYGTISPNDLNLFHQTDSVDDAFDYLVRELSGND